MRLLNEQAISLARQSLKLGGIVDGVAIVVHARPSARGKVSDSRLRIEFDRVTALLLLLVSKQCRRRAQSMSIVEQVAAAGIRSGISANSDPVPPLGEQRAIAEVLGALDDKIEANRRMKDALLGSCVDDALSAERPGCRSRTSTRSGSRARPTIRTGLGGPLLRIRRRCKTFDAVDG